MKLLRHYNNEVNQILANSDKDFSDKINNHHHNINNKNNNNNNNNNNKYYRFN